MHCILSQPECEILCVAVVLINALLSFSLLTQHFPVWYNVVLLCAHIKTSCDPKPFWNSGGLTWTGSSLSELYGTSWHQGQQGFHFHVEKFCV